MRKRIHGLPATINTAAAGKVRIHLLHDVGSMCNDDNGHYHRSCDSVTFTQLGAYCVGRYPWSIIRDLIRGYNGHLVCLQR